MIERSTASGATPSSSASGRSWMRCRSTGTAIAWMWSGVTPSAPISQAQAPCGPVSYSVAEQKYVGVPCTQ